MQSAEFIRSIERTWSKQMSQEQRATYGRKIHRFSPRQLESIFDSLLEGCKYFPKVAEIFSTASELGFLQKREGQLKTRVLGRQNCPDCQGTGWERVEGPVTTVGGNETPQAVKACECRRNHETEEPTA